MFLTVHAVAGLTISQFLPNPLLNFAAGFLSHFLLDLIPHGDERLGMWCNRGNRVKRLAVISGIDGLVAIAYIAYWTWNLETLRATSLPWDAWLGAFAGMLPDILWGINALWRTELLTRYEKFHACIHNLLTDGYPYTPALITQLAAIAICSWLLF